MRLASGQELLSRKLLFVHGKGGVGKTLFARSLADLLAHQRKKTLLVLMEDSSMTAGELVQVNAHLSVANLEPLSSFDEYARLKIGSATLVKLFLQNKFMNYAVQAAPGIKEVLFLGKLWYELKNFDHVVVDLPASGHAITLFQTFKNWSELFKGSLIGGDTQKIRVALESTSDTGHVILALPEEMPLVEALDLRSALESLFTNGLASHLVLNQKLPNPASPGQLASDDKPFSETASEHLAKKSARETERLQLWKDEPRTTIPYLFGETTPALRLALQNTLQTEWGVA